MAKNSAVNLDITNNADGYDISGGTTPRKLTVTGADVTLTGSGTNVYTMPSATDTLLGRTSTDTVTNKNLSSTTNTFPASSSTSAAVATQQTTTSTSFTDLTTSGPAVTVTTGTKALVTVYGWVENNTASQWAVMGFAVSGATTIAGADTDSLMVGNPTGVTNMRIGISATFLVTLTAGSNTFTAKYRVTGGTGTFLNRKISVTPL